MLFFMVLLGFSVQSESVDWGCQSSEPVCGTDGKTYKDICEFNVAKISDQDLQVLYEGRCLDHNLLQGSAQLNIQNLPPTINKKYSLHFRTKESNAISILDDCPPKCRTVCPRNTQEAKSTLYYTKSCMNCCSDWN